MCIRDSSGTTPEKRVFAGTINMGQAETGIFEGHPLLTSSPRISYISSSIGEGLVTTNQDFSAAPMLSKSWEISHDLSKWTWHIQNGVKFHKGYGELTATDVLYSYRQFGDGALHARSGLIRDYFESANVIDKYTIVIDTDTPWNQHQIFELLNNGGGVSSWIVSEKQSRDLGVESASRNIAATGPWQITDHSAGEYWRMSAVREHWRQTPYFQELIYWTIPVLSLIHI